MRAWHIFALGSLVVLAAVLMPLYHTSFAACGALAVAGVVAFGFMLHPRNSIFYLRTSVELQDYEENTLVEHDRIAVRVELTRLWILFVPTFLAVVFLTLTWAQGMHRNFSWLEAMGRNSFVLVVGWRLAIAGLIVLNAILSAWISERWTLRNAHACSARSLTASAGRVSYAFTNENGEFYGGEALMVAGGYTLQVARIVVYNPARPDINKIAIGCLFHRFVIIGHGLTDLDEQTVSQLAVAPAAT